MATPDTAPPNGGAQPTPLQALDTISAAVSQATTRGQEMYQASIAAWTQEADNFFSDMTRDGSTALEQLKACKSPIDVLGVEQAWMMARSKAYTAASARFIQAAMAGFRPAIGPGEPPL